MTNSTAGSTPSTAPAAPTFERLKQACIDGVAEGWLCEREGGGIRYGRVFKAEDALHRFSVDVVDMKDIAGPHHTHPDGEIDLIMPLEGDATFDGRPAGWCVYPPGSAAPPHRGPGPRAGPLSPARRADPVHPDLNAMTELLSNYVAGRWQAGSGAGTPLFDPVLGTELARVDATGLDLAEAFGFARETGGAALRALTYRAARGACWPPS